MKKFICWLRGHALILVKYRTVHGFSAGHLECQRCGLRDPHGSA